MRCSLHVALLVGVLALVVGSAVPLRAQDFVLPTDYTSFAAEARGFLERADQFMAEGRFEEALGKLREAARLETDRERGYDIKIREALVSLYQGKVGFARLSLNRITRAYFYAPALIASAQTYIYYPPYDREEGRKRLAQVLGKEPKNWLALIEMGYCEFFLGNLDAAKKHFDKAVQINGGAMRAFYGLADIEFKKRKWMDAVRVLESALRVQPENAETMAKIGDVFMGSTLARRTDSAVAWYDRALEYGQRQPRLYAAVMLAFFARFTAGNSVPYLNKLRAFAPDNSYVKWADGVLLELEGRVAAAVQKFQEAVAQDSRNWYAHFSLANIYAGRGNEEYVRWAKTSNYKYSAHGDTQKGIEEYRFIKNNNPTFPFSGVVDDWFHFLQEKPQTSPLEDPAFKEELQRMKRVGTLMRKGMY